MDSNDKFWLLFWAIIVSGITIITVSITLTVGNYHTTALRQGYVQEQMYGNHSMWVKK